MVEFRLERQMLVARPIDTVFRFFGDPLNLETITPPWLRFSVLEGSGAPLREGSTIRYRLRLHGIPLRWTSLISRWDPPALFVDEQIRGPYRKWIHKHSFEERGGETIVRDRVVYAVPGGAATNWLFVRRDLEKIFDYRRDRLREVFGAVDASPHVRNGVPEREDDACLFRAW